MVIEFTGLPGSGKSTVCKELEPWLKSEGYEVINWIYHTGFMSKPHRIAHKLWVSTVFFFAHPVLFFGSVRLVIKSKQKNKKEVLSQFLNLIYISALYRRYNHNKYKNTLVLFDQGKIQAMISLIFRSGVHDIRTLLTDPILKNYANHMVIQIDVSLDESLNRLERRKGEQSRIEKTDLKERRAALEKFQEVGDIVLKYDSLSENLIRINGHGLAKEEILYDIKRILMEQLVVDR